MTVTPVREKTIAWDDPMAIAAAGRGRPGLEFLAEMVAGDVAGPPIGSLLGMSLDDLAGYLPEPTGETTS